MSHKQPPSAEKVVFSLITLRLLSGQQAAAAGPINPSFGHICLPGLMADVSPLSARYFLFQFSSEPCRESLFCCRGSRLNVHEKHILKESKIIMLLLPF